MSQHELEKLFGGFAADTLTPEEKKALYAAALQDQQLFNALADEQALKELLADPAVRRRLVQALHQTGTSGAGGSLSWLDWFRRPAGLAFVGGLAAAVFAVVLGSKIYKDSLKQTVQSVATEEAKPAVPPTPEPLIAPPAQSLSDKIELKAKKDALPDKTAKREPASTPPVPDERQASRAARDQVTQRSEQRETPKQLEAPVAASGKASEQVAASADQLQSTPPATGPAPAPMQAPAGAPGSGVGTSAVSARAMFYSRESGRSDQRAMAAEKDQGLKALSESGPQASRPERRLDKLATAGKAVQFKPLGLRYGFMIRGSDGQDREVDAATVSKSAEPVRLTVEANQDAYVQIWKMMASSTPQLLFPEKDTGQISFKLTAGQRQAISFSNERGALTIRLSRVPFGPITRQEAAMLDRPSPNQLEESITPSSPAGAQEHASYVVNQDPSPSAQIVVEIPFR
jgi:hypothetical protein